MSIARRITIATLITLIDNTVPVAADFNANFVAINAEIRPANTGGTGQSVYATGDILYAPAANTLSRLAAGSTNTTLTMVAATSGASLVPSWVGGGVQALQNYRGITNSAVPSTKYDMTAELVRLRNPTTGATRTVVANTTTLTNDIAAATTVNGRDQASAFTTSSWVYLFFVGSGFGPATSLASASPTAPALLTGQNEWALADAHFNTSAPLLLATISRGSWVYYQASQSLVAAGSTTGETTVSMASLVPPNALAVLLRCATVNGAGAGTQIGHLRVVTGVDYFVQSVTATDTTTASVVVPNVNQQIMWITEVSGQGGSTFAVDVLGYQMPNRG